jgi:tetratricopeptide (TPR) repeat protein
MTPNELLEQIEHAPDTARELLKQNKVKGINRAFCDRVVHYFGTNTGKAAALSGLWHTFKTYGDEQAPALRARAINERLKGNWRASAEAFVKAGGQAEDPVERLSFQVGAIDSYARGGQVEKAVLLGEHLATELIRLDQPGLAARVHLNLGNALFWQDRMEEARHHLSRATPSLKAHGFLVEAASARMALSTTHLFGGRLKEARLHAVEAKDEAEHIDAKYLSHLCDINLAHVEILSGRPDDALDRLLRLKEALSDAPVDHARTLEFLGDAYFRLNLWPEAVDAYEEALAQPALIALHRAHLHLGLGQALRAAGRPQAAIEQLRTARTAYNRLRNRAWASAAMAAEAQALLDEGRIREARSLSRRAAKQAHDSGASFYHAEALLIACSIDPSPHLLSEADRVVRKQGYLGLIWQVHYLRAKTADGGKKLPHFRRMFEAIQSGRLHVSSLASRASYFRDKNRAVQEFLEELLKRNRSEEAVQIIEQTRSITLLDELLSARESALRPETLERLKALREELRELGIDENNTGAARRSLSQAAPMASLQRRWLDLTRELRSETQSLLPPRRDAGVILAQTQLDLYAIADGTPHRLPMNVQALEKALRWLQFELLAPLADRNAPADEALKILGRLAEGLLQPWASKDQQIALSPDGILWRVPWSACVAVSLEREAELRLHPSLGGNMMQIIGRNPRVALWCSNAPDLPHAGIEAKQFMESYPQAEVFTSADQIRSEMTGRFDLVHVVAHAKHRAANPMFSAVAFQDGPLFASEIARLGIKPDLVTLSACETGTMSVVSRDEPDGLARAFLARGARNVIASMWPLDDEVASRMFGDFFASLTSGASVGEALAQARQRARKWRMHPYFWGSLALYGGYSNS